MPARNTGGLRASSMKRCCGTTSCVAISPGPVQGRARISRLHRHRYYVSLHYCEPALRYLFPVFQSFAAGGWIVAWLSTTVLGLEGISAVAIGFCLQPADRSWPIAVPIRCSRSISPPLLRSRLDTPAIGET
jgi:hypothetical protein